MKFMDRKNISPSQDDVLNISIYKTYFSIYLVSLLTVCEFCSIIFENHLS